MTQLGYNASGPLNAPVVVLGPSLGTTRRMWDGAAATLAQRYRVVQFDLLGHGTSAVPEGPYTIGRIGGAVLDLLDDLGVGTVNYAGVSMGGMLGMWLAINAPERIERLALVCTSAHLPGGNWMERAAQVRAHGTASIADAVLSRWFTPPFLASSPLAADFRTMIVDCPDKGYAACCDAVGGMDLRASLPSISAPTLVIAGAQDPATPPPHGEAIANAVPGARLVVLDNAAHLANVERADDVAALLTAFLPGPMTDARETGERVRREVLGDAHVDAATAAADGFTGDFQDLITTYAWGEIWGRDGLDRRMRSAITVAMLASLRHEHELALHLRGAIRNGLTRDEIKEILLQVAIYAGVPAANTAFAIARRVFSSGEDSGGES
jgi:3-oxoadipate enol-lactonase/4-carboxymuconolactone decarboxylase